MCLATSKHSCRYLLTPTSWVFVRETARNTEYFVFHPCYCSSVQTCLALIIQYSDHRVLRISLFSFFFVDLILNRGLKRNAQTYSLVVKTCEIFRFSQVAQKLLNQWSVGWINGTLIDYWQFWKFSRVFFLVSCACINRAHVYRSLVYIP